MSFGQREGLRAVIYARVSKDDGNTAGASSTDRQIEDCRLLAGLRRYDVLATEVDQGVSAYGKRSRPAWERVLGMVERGEVDVVVAWHVDRMTRNMLDLERLILLTEEKGVGVATVTGDMDLTTDTGRMVARILAAVARAEVERKGARQRRANQQRAIEGQPWKSGWRAFGFEKDGKHVEQEAALIREAAEKVLAGESLRSIVRHWQSLGVTTPRSSKGVDGWTHNGVRSILLNPRNAGLATYRGKVVGKGAWEPIFSEETHTLLVAGLTDPGRSTNGGKRGRKAANLLSGIATCGTCGGKVGGGAGYKGKPIYQCKAYHVSTDRAAADQIVRAAFAAAVATTRPGVLMPLRSGSEDAQGLLREADVLRDRLNGLAGSYAAGAISLEQMESASTTLRERIESIEQRVSVAGVQSSGLLEQRAADVQQFVDLDLEGQRAILSRLAVIELHPQGRGNRRKPKPIKEQVTVHLRAKRKDGTEYLIPALADQGALRPSAKDEPIYG